MKQQLLTGSDQVILAASIYVFFALKLEKENNNISKHSRLRAEVAG